MILLTSVSDLIEVVTSSTLTIHVHASYVDVSGTTVTPGRTNTIISSATTTTVVGSPGSSTQRNLKFLSIQNTSTTTAETITVEHTDGTNVIQLLAPISLLPGYTLQYNDLEGWICVSATAVRLQAFQPSGLLLKTTVLTSTSSATFTTGTASNSIRAFIVGGGGQGGGAPATAGSNGSGGGSGSYAEYFAAVSPSTGYTYQCGAGGTTGGTNANGQNGSSTTLTIGATTVTVPGGGGGLVGTTNVLPHIGGAGGALSTNGTLNSGGQPGGIALSAAANGWSGSGGFSQLGAGANSLISAANATGNSAASLGFGGGGGGATSGGAAQAGGAGAPGCIVIEEYA